MMDLGMTGYQYLGGVLAAAEAGGASDEQPSLGGMEIFAISARATVTNTGTSVVNGDLGLAPGTSVTGFPPGVLNGTQHVNDAIIQQAQLDLLAAWTEMQARPGTTIADELGGVTLSPGVYDVGAGIISATVLTLDGGGDSNAVFIIRCASTLTLAASTGVTLINGARAGRVFFLVGSSATLGASSFIRGTVMAAVSITGVTGATVVTGRLLAGAAGNDTGAVTLDTNTVTIPTDSITTVAGSVSVDASPGTVIYAWAVPHHWEIIDFGVLITQDFSVHTVDPVVRLQSRTLVAGPVTVIKDLTLGTTNLVGLTRGDGDRNVRELYPRDNQVQLALDADLNNGDVVHADLDTVDEAVGRHLWPGQVLELVHAVAADEVDGAYIPYVLVRISGPDFTQDNVWRELRHGEVVRD